MDAAASIAAALHASLSPDRATREPAAAALQEYEKLPEYWQGLVAVIAAREQLDLPLRQAASVQLKNGCDRFWRKSAPNAIPPHVKADLRPKLVELLDETDGPIGKSVEICIARMAKWDYDADWPDLPNILLSLLTANFSSRPIIARRALSTLKHIIKTLSSNRMPRARLLNQRFCQTIFPTVLSLYTQAFQAWSAQPTSDSAADQLEVTHLAFKTIRLILMYGWAKADANPEAVTLIHASLDHLRLVQQVRLQCLAQGIPADRRDLALLESQAFSYLKLYKSLLGHDAVTMAAIGFTALVVDACRQIVQDAAADPEKLIGEERSSAYSERFMAKVLVVLKLSLVDWAVNVPHPQAAAVGQDLARSIATRLLVLRTSELEDWTADPEEWANVNDSDYNDFEMRPCANALLKVLANRYAEVVETLKQLLAEVTGASTGVSPLLKDAVYLAVSQCSSSMANVVDLDRWISSSLVTEATTVSPESRVLRRRVAAVLGEWAGDDASPAARSKSYAILVQLLADDPASDISVRLAAAQALDASIGNSWHFDEQAFVPHLDEAMQRLLTLLFDCALPDSQLRVTCAIGVLIERLSSHIAPFAQRLLQALPVIWSNAGETHLLRVAVLTTMAKLVDALGEQSQALHDQIAPLLAYSIDPQVEGHVFLQEDGIDLWLAVIRQATSLSPPLFGLLPILMRLLSAGTDTLPKTLRLFESYCLLDGARVLEATAADLFAILQILLGDIRMEASKALLHTLAMAIYTAPSSAWVSQLDATGCFRKLLEPLQSQETALLIGKYLTLLSRIVIIDVDAFLRCIASTASKSGASERDILHLILQQWFEKLDNLLVSQRKLVALALASLIGKAVPIVLERMNDVFAVWLITLSETEESETGDASVYRGDAAEAAGLDDDFSAMLERDPIHAVRLLDVVRSQLAALEAAAGGAEQLHATFLHAIDPLVVDELTRRLRGELKG